jgi:hypothetical protein
MIVGIKTQWGEKNIHEKAQNSQTHMEKTFAYSTRNVLSLREFSLITFVEKMTNNKDKHSVFMSLGLALMVFAPFAPQPSFMDSFFSLRISSASVGEKNLRLSQWKMGEFIPFYVNSSGNITRNNRIRNREKQPLASKRNKKKNFEFKLWSSFKFFKDVIFVLLNDVTTTTNT